MLRKRELPKLLIFLSTIWATLSSGSSHWRKKGLEDNPSLEHRKAVRTTSNQFVNRNENGPQWENLRLMNNTHYLQQYNDVHPMQTITKRMSTNKPNSTKVKTGSSNDNMFQLANDEEKSYRRNS
ncbi:hypothetical protein CEXT_741471 [Caerostris extrusa]|uniref:Uncharacterized protein n=1 Tax=Caerostris extrusa TaxID=172846 RepID=A0AAV4UCA3_CAEEX|nr:hypothetical protein CEXT_741471 [Caerostris extrusa]